MKFKMLSLFGCAYRFIMILKKIYYFVSKYVCLNTIVLLFHNISLFLMPPVCASCRQFLSVRAVLCNACKDTIIPIVSTKISVTSTISMKLFSISEYKNPLRKLILAKGISDTTISYQMGQLVWDMTPVRYVDFDYVVPIPLHWSRYAWRGFNQAEIIARVIAKKKNVPMVNLLKRVKRTEFQSKLRPLERVANVRDAFVLTVVTNEKYKDKHILLVDDLVTTGSTLKAAAKELLKLNPKTITVVSVCRVI